MPIEVGVSINTARDENIMMQDSRQISESRDHSPKKEGVAGSIGLSLYLQYMRCMSYVMLMVTIMFFTPF